MTYYAMHVRRYRTLTVPCDVRDSKKRAVVLFCALFTVDWEELPEGKTSCWFGERPRYGLVSKSTREKEDVDLRSEDAVFFHTPMDRKKYIWNRIDGIQQGMKKRAMQAAVRKAAEYQQKADRLARQIEMAKVAAEDIDPVYLEMEKNWFGGC